jgi:predicted membrane channel-forming protein YqfA (hemolysin III family)
MNDKNNAPHILGTSANLLGICFIVLTSLKALKMDGQTFIDEFACGAVCLFMISCLFSFLSMRGTSKRTQWYETVADYVFLAGLFTLCITTIFIAFSFMH